MKSIKFVHTFDVTDIAREAESLPLEAWLETKPWSDPENLANSTIGEYSKQSGKSLIREQDRVLLMWHKSIDDQPWWTHAGYRKFATAPTQWSDQCPRTMQILSEHFAKEGKQLVRLYFSKLQPGHQVYPHEDQEFGDDFEKITRYGLCVTTNDQCELRCADDACHVPQGTMYWIDNVLVHSATNFGAQDRIHMYMDVR